EKSANEVDLQVSSLGGEACALGASRLIAEKILDDLYLGWRADVVSESRMVVPPNFETPKQQADRCDSLLDSPPSLLDRKRELNDR
ncbi:MAG: hypothetical protein ACLQMO_11645, partial [Acidobacteriaceae bacterium]